MQQLLGCTLIGHSLPEILVLPFMVLTSSLRLRLHLNHFQLAG